MGPVLATPLTEAKAKNLAVAVAEKEGATRSQNIRIDNSPTKTFWDRPTSIRTTCRPTQLTSRTPLRGSAPRPRVAHAISRESICRRIHYSKYQEPKESLFKANQSLNNSHREASWRCGRVGFRSMRLFNMGSEEKGQRKRPVHVCSTMNCRDGTYSSPACSDRK